MVGSSPDITEQKVADEELRALYAEQRRVALTLQQHFVHPLPDVEGVELAAVSEAASEAGLIGGDFHDVFLLPEGRIVVLLGDVEGKGVAAAGLTETVRSAVRALSLVSSAPAEILDLVNRLLLAEPSEQHVTALLAVVDPASGAGTFASAAHPAPLHLSPDGCEYLEPVYGLPLGTFDLPYEEQPLRLASGDTLLLYTDGLTEARRRGQFFGPERLLSEARRSSMRPPLELVKGLKESVTAFADEVRDDIEILALHYCPRAEAFGRSAAASVPYEVEAQSS
jgi:sigma-B regulation protein RsbU (phosphoserine phosphatase)